MDRSATSPITAVAMKRRARRRSNTTRFRPRLETLESRRLLAAATDLASISGLVFDDFTGNGFDNGEQVAGAALDLYRDDGDMNFDPTPTGGDVAVRMTITDAGGRYSFNRLPAGNYFVQQPAQPLLGLQQQVSPLIMISSTDVQGQTVTTIDTFDGTAQTVSDAVSDGIAATSSESRRSDWR